MTCISDYPAEKIDRIHRLDIEIRKIKTYFTNRYIWLNPSRYNHETNWIMFNRALLIFDKVTTFLEENRINPVNKKRLRKLCRTISVIYMAVPVAKLHALCILINERREIWASINAYSSHSHACIYSY